MMPGTHRSFVGKHETLGKEDRILNKNLHLVNTARKLTEEFSFRNENKRSFNAEENSRDIKTKSFQSHAHCEKKTA